MAVVVGVLRSIQVHSQPAVANFISFLLSTILYYLQHQVQASPTLIMPASHRSTTLPDHVLAAASDALVCRGRRLESGMTCVGLLGAQ